MIFIIFIKSFLNFCTIDLSAFYFDIRKDTLYCDPKNSEKRKSSQILLLNVILNSLLKWFAPILSFTTEEIYQLNFKKKKEYSFRKISRNFLKNLKILELNKKWSQNY